MRNIKILGLALVAVFALSAIAANAAFAAGEAPHWTVTEGGLAKTLSATETRNLEGTTTGTPTLTGGGITLTSTGCTTTGKIKGSGAEVPGTFTGKLKCTGVAVTGAPNCIPHSPGAANGTVETNNLLGTLVWLESTGDAKVGVLFQADSAGGTGETEGLFVKIELTNKSGTETCAISTPVGGLPVNNEVLCEASPVTTHVVNGTLNCPTPFLSKYWSNATPRVEKSVTRLKLNANNATFTADSNTIHLEGNVEWGIEPA